MRVHFREKYGTRGEEILYVTPAGNVDAKWITNIKLEKLWRISFSFI